MSSSAPLSFKPILAVVLVVVGGLMIVAVVICAIVRFHHSRRNRRRAAGGIESRGGSGGGSGGGGGGECRCEPCTVLHETVTTCQGKKIGFSILKEVLPPPTSPRDTDNSDIIPLSDSDSWPNEGVNTISLAALPSTCASLPHPGHLYSLSSYQVCLGSELSYKELMMCGPNTNTSSAPSEPRHRTPQQRVGYATPSHKHLCSSSYPHQRHPYSLYSSANNSPKHYTSSNLLLHQSPNLHGLYHQGTPSTISRGQAKGVSWGQTSTFGRRHYLRRDPGGCHDQDCRVPLMSNQKESSV
ncbi:hypothetical protein SK128_012447 [Halocaridina rubra]|uniref:Uncharacterized protein n=1 Tax=Halocaridina rubra TaxID=373956 RepID=A0AAN9A4M8_HALRR